MSPRQPPAGSAPLRMQAVLVRSSSCDLSLHTRWSAMKRRHPVRRAALAGDLAPVVAGIALATIILAGFLAPAVSGDAAAPRGPQAATAAWNLSTVDPRFLAALEWRSIGPFRGEGSGGRRRSRQPSRVLHGDGARRGVEDDRRRSVPGGTSRTRSSRQPRSARWTCRPPAATLCMSERAKGLPASM